MILRAVVVRGRGRAVRRAALAALLAAAVVGAATWVVFHSPVLGVREIEVIGNPRVPAEWLRTAAGVRPGTPLANVDLDEVERRVRAVREVESARVERVWPGTLRISVVERVPVAVVPMAAAAGGEAGVGETSAVVDRFGVILWQAAVVPPRLPVLRVQRPAPEDPATRAALTVLGAVRDALPDGVRVSEVRAPSPKSITLKLADGRTVLWGDAGRAAEKARVLAAALGQPGTFYDVSTPRVVTVK